MQGFYVNIDYHSNNYTNQIAGGDGSIFDKPTWTQTWVYLLETIVKSVPQAQGKLLVDLINEPDGCAPTCSLCQGCSVLLLPMLPCASSVHVSCRGPDVLQTLTLCCSRCLEPCQAI